MAVAFFDLDGTITHRDTLVPLVLRLLAAKPVRLLKLVAVVPAIARFTIDRDRGALKQSLLRATLRGLQRAEISRVSNRFVQDTIGHNCFAEALATIRRHRDAGHILVLMSASVDFYVPEFGRQLGFDQVLSTGVRWDGDRLDGSLTTANLRGEEKARKVRDLLAGRNDSETFAYGNSDSDLPHLKVVRHGLLVNGSSRARRKAHEVGVPTADWV